MSEIVCWLVKNVSEIQKLVKVVIFFLNLLLYDIRYEYECTAHTVRASTDLT